ncbi:50S ribosomal protein L21 [Candidatus Tremblaya princeps]|uniref:50S ribosomal protein L21 n=1 Tax=Tremblaya princeps TaxID=189385 RepID=A0A143WNC0_TREPR|nr:50S ribosomal protein L21 [Candidatus Tremblaya princeps]
MQHHPAMVASIMGAQHLICAGTRLAIPRLDMEGGAEFYVRTSAPLNERSISLPVRLRHGYALAAVLRHAACPRVAILKLRRRKHHRRRMTHRQTRTDVVIAGLAAYPSHGAEEGRRHNQER